MNLLPLADRVVIRPIDETEKKTAGGLFKPATAELQELLKGEIVAVGPGKFANGQLVPMVSKIGDIVLYRRPMCDKLPDDQDGKYIVTNEDCVICKYKEQV
jgi:chaperonin GroES